MTGSIHLAGELNRCRNDASRCVAMKNKRPDIASVCATVDLRHKFNSRRFDENITGMGIF